jgi:hypothetical protein
MALTTEQQAQVDIQTAVENVRHANQSIVDRRRVKLEAVRLSKEILIENARSKPVDSRDVAATDVIAFATTLITYIESE